MQLGYARCSTDEQADALQAQVSRLRAAGCKEVIQELVSGGKNDRPGVLELIDRIKRGKVSELLVTRVDRLGRDAAFTDTLLALAAEKGVKVRALDGGEVEAASPAGFVMSRILTTMAEHERRMQSQRIRQQFTEYRKQGRHLRRRICFGYTKGDNHRLAPHPDEWLLAKRILKRLDELASFSRVAYELPQWCPWTPAPNNLQAWFVNPCLRGHIAHKHIPSSGKGWGSRWEELHRDQHPPLIDEKAWTALKVRLQATKNKFEGRTLDGSKHALTGVLVCKSCGHRMRRNSSAGVDWWRCRHRACTSRAGIKEKDVLPFVLKLCQLHAYELTQAAARPVDENPALELKEADLKALREMAERNPGLAPSVVQLEAEIKAMKESPKPAWIDEELFLKLQSEEFYAGQPPERLRELISTVLERVTVERGENGPKVVGVPHPLW